MKTSIDQLSLEIQQLETQTRLTQAIYDDLLLEMMAKLEQRVKEVRNGAMVLPFADLQAANLATDLKVKVLEDKLDDAQVANEQLTFKLEVLVAQNVRLESQGQQLQQQLHQSQIEAQNQLALVKNEAQKLHEQLEKAQESQIET